MKKALKLFKVRDLLLTGLFVMILALMGVLPQPAQLLPGAAEDAFAADDDGTTYTVFIYSGKEGYFGEQGKTVKKITGNAYDDEVTIRLSDLDLKVKDPNQYYVRGLKVAGHDNDELSSVQFNSYTFNIKEDMSFSVAYGMAGGMVKYTVKYVDEDGKALHDSEEFYGMAGDKPVVAFRHVKGYLPDNYNLSKMLSENEADNVFTFTYHKVYENNSSEDEEEGEDTDNEGNNANARNNGNAGAGAVAANNGNAPGTNITNLDDNETPLTDIDNQETPKSGIFSGATAALIGIIIAGILIALGLLYLILRRRKEEEE